MAQEIAVGGPRAARGVLTATLRRVVGRHSVGPETRVEFCAESGFVPVNFICAHTPSEVVGEPFIHMLKVVCNGVCVDSRL